MSVTLRPVAMDDAELLLAWRNDEATRAASINQEPVALGDHLAWLGRVLANPDRHLYIGELGDEPIGTVRLDGDGERAEVNITIAPEARGRGLSKALLRALVAQGGRLGFAALDAVVRHDNAASLALFDRVGFERSKTDEQLQHFVLPLEPPTG